MPHPKGHRPFTVVYYSKHITLENIELLHANDSYLHFKCILTHPFFYYLVEVDIFKTRQNMKKIKILQFSQNGHSNVCLKTAKQTIIFCLNSARAVLNAIT